MKKKITLLVLILVGLFAFKSYSQTPNFENQITILVFSTNDVTINNLFTDHDSVSVWIVSEMDTTKLLISDSLMQPIIVNTQSDRIVIYGDVTGIRLNNNTNVSGLYSQFNNKLKKVECSGNTVEYIGFGDDSNLEYILASKNNINNANFTDCPRLREISLFNNNLTSLKEFNYLDSLEVLNLNANQLISLNANNFPKLKKIYCQDNQLSACELDYLFTTLADRTSMTTDSGFVTIALNPGMNECRTFIASNKNWRVLDNMSVGATEIVNTNFTCNAIYNNKITLNVVPQREISFKINNYTSNTPVVILNGQDTIYTFASYMEYANAGNKSLEKSSMSYSNPYDLKFTTNSNSVEIFGDVNQFHASQVDSTTQSIELINNSSIKSFVCYRNDLLTDATINNCDSLSNLGISRSPLFTSLNVKSCPSLINLSCCSNNLPNLNIEQCEALRYIDCDGNNLSACAIDSIFHMLPNRNGVYEGVIILQDGDETNPGNFTCRDTLATNKNWKVWEFHTHTDIINSIYDCPYFTIGLSSVPSIIEARIYPNPMKDELIIETPNKIEKIEVYDVMGRRVNYNNSSSLGTTKLDCLNLESGVYLINIQTKEGKGTYKIIKE
ncbi:MAG: T9SS type A sorting domain-containing protein [Bacteroidales bacterium]|jgi:hypothetical protein